MNGAPSTAGSSSSHLTFGTRTWESRPSASSTRYCKPISYSSNTASPNGAARHTNPSRSEAPCSVYAASKMIVSLEKPDASLAPATSIAMSDAPSSLVASHPSSPRRATSGSCCCRIAMVVGPPVPIRCRNSMPKRERTLPASIHDVDGTNRRGSLHEPRLCSRRVTHGSPERRRVGLVFDDDEVEACRAPRAMRRRSASATSSDAIPCRRRCGCTASRYIVPRIHPSR